MDSIFRNAAVVLVIVNKNREVVDINKSGELFAGSSKDEVLGQLGGKAISCINATEGDKVVCGRGKHCGNCILRNSVNSAFEYGKETFKKEGVMSIATAKGGYAERNVLVSSSLINYNGEKMVLLTLDDVTQQKETEKKLHEINQMKDRFFSIVAHDLKNPFNSILGYSELLMDMVEGDEISDEKHMFVKYLHNSSKQAYALLEDLLTWARMQMNRIPFNPEKISINRIIEDNIQLNKPAAHKKDVALKADVANQYFVEADKFMVTTVIRNIVSNAVKFTHAKGEVVIGVSPYGINSIKIEIKDNGIGIPEHTLDKLFNIEKNFSTPGTAGEKGTGLGLVLCREFIEKNNGNIGVESEFGKGTTFWFTLPLSEN